ncbi:MAG: hypothetical protein ABJP48_04765 [Erythrobacter sp.]
MRKLGSVAMSMALASCAGSGGAGPPPAPSLIGERPLTTTVAAGADFRPPEMQEIDGVSGLIGARAEQLTAAFGNPRIDLAEGDARKLQFAGENCVLDVFLYPLEPGQNPVATHVEAREPENGRDFDRARCIANLTR